MVGRVCDIESFYGSDYWIWNEDKSYAYLFPRSSFTVMIEEEESIGVFQDMDKTIAKFNDALVDMGLKVINK